MSPAANSDDLRRIFLLQNRQSRSTGCVRNGEGVDATLWKCLHLPVPPLAIFQQKQKSFVFTHISAHIHFSHCLYFFFLHPQSLLVLSDQVGLEPHIVAVTNGCANCLPKLYQSCNQPRCLCSTNSSTGQVPKYSGENRFGPSRIGVKKIETSLQRKRKQVHLNVIFIQYAWIVRPRNLWAVFCGYTEPGSRGAWLRIGQF